jgi:hypothetical protein
MKALLRNPRAYALVAVTVIATLVGLLLFGPEGGVFVVGVASGVTLAVTLRLLRLTEQTNKAARSTLTATVDAVTKQAAASLSDELGPMQSRLDELVAEMGRLRATVSMASSRLASGAGAAQD